MPKTAILTQLEGHVNNLDAAVTALGKVLENDALNFDVSAAKKNALAIKTALDGITDCQNRFNAKLAEWAHPNFISKVKNALKQKALAQERAIATAKYNNLKSTAATLSSDYNQLKVFLKIAGVPV